MFLCHLIDLKFLHIWSGFICFKNFVLVSNFSIFASRRSELRIVKWHLNSSKYGAHIKDIFVLFMFIITEDPFKKNGVIFFTMYRRTPEWTVSIFNVIRPNHH
jgi:hypothetical protein